MVGSVHRIMLYVSVFFCCAVSALSVASGDAKVFEEANTSSSQSQSENSPFTAMLMEIILGMLFITFTPVFLWLAEAQVVRFEIIIRRCQLATRPIKNINKILRNYDSRPVYVKGKTRAEKDALDMELGYHAPGKVVRLERIVEMFQWSEIKEKDNDGNEVFSYTKNWLDVDTDSYLFHDSASHRNPPRHPAVYSAIFNSPQVLVGAFLLNPTQVSMLTDWRPCPITSVPPSFPRDMYVYSPKAEFGFLVCGGSIENPHIGTVRIKYNVVRDNGLVSTIAVQQGFTFRPFVEKDAHRTSNYQVVEKSIGFSSSTMDNDATNPNYITKEQIGAWSSSIDTTDQGVHTNNEKIMDLDHYMKRDASYQLDSDDEETEAQREHNLRMQSITETAEESERQLGCLDHFKCCMSCCICMCCKPGVDLLRSLADWSIGSGIVLLEEADVSITDMFRHEWSRFSMRTWIIRVVSYLLLGLGLYMVFFGPVVYVLKFIPYVGWLAEHILFFAAILVGLLEGLLITTLASAFHRPSLLAAYLLAIGFALWFGAHSAGWIFAGQVVCATALLPIGVYIYQWIEEWRFVSYQKKLDAEGEGESARLLAV